MAMGLIVFMNHKDKNLSESSSSTQQPNSNSSPRQDIPVWSLRNGHQQRESEVNFAKIGHPMKKNRFKSSYAAQPQKSVGPSPQNSRSGAEVQWCTGPVGSQETDDLAVTPKCN